MNDAVRKFRKRRQKRLDARNYDSQMDKLYGIAIEMGIVGASDMEPAELIKALRGEGINADKVFENLHKGESKQDKSVYEYKVDLEESNKKINMAEKKRDNAVKKYQESLSAYNEMKEDPDADEFFIDILHEELQEDYNKLERARNEVNELYRENSRIKEQINEKKSQKKNSRGKINRNQKLEKALETGEDGIRDDDTETGICYDEDGNELFRANSGEEGMVVFDPEQAFLLTDGTVTHNHPSGLTFSSVDIETSLKWFPRETRVCHSTGSYALRRKYDVGDSIPQKYMMFADDYRNAEDKYMSEYLKKRYPGDDKKSVTKRMVLRAEYANEWLHKNAERYGWEYEER